VAARERAGGHENTDGPEPAPGADPADAERAAAGVEVAAGGAGGRERDAADGGAPRRWWAARLATAVLLALLGFAIPVTVRSVGPPAGLAGARPEELVRAVDESGAQSRRVDREVAGLERTRAVPPGPAGPTATATGDARREAEGLAVLAGTVPVAGPGVEITVTDPHGTVGADVLIDALAELRDAGAEAIEISGVRVVVSTFISDRPEGGLIIDGSVVTAPYRLLVVGDAHTIEQAMRIPGGVLDTVASRNGATAQISSRDRIEIRALRPLPTPRYARPAG
jgi:uncharacterized protein YlxW (UPF0749 family)